ncbi:hypothetical protein Gorai_022853, partial [Gossypium raimondii]|nr:hypothetical protein [Gossypium raimondii]
MMITRKRRKRRKIGSKTLKRKRMTIMMWHSSCN